MRWMSGILAIVACAGIAATAKVHGQDLSAMERKIAKEPAYLSGAPKYALMVFGEKMTTRVWLVIDGDVLYADLNGNGDLTEEGEKIAKMDFGKLAPPDGSKSFEIKEIQDGELVHSDFKIGMEPAGRLAEMGSDFLKLLQRDTKAFSINVGGMVQVPGRHGSGHGGRKLQLAWVDEKGPLQFASTAVDAPILHFGGKLKVGLFGEHQLVTGRAKDISLGIGTPGIGAGSTVWMEYNEIPLKTPVFAEVLYPKGKNAAEGRRQKTTLVDRCCTFNLLGQITAPEDAGLGSAEVEFRLDSLSQPHLVEPLKTSIDVIAPKNKIAMVPVTKRIAKEYLFPKRNVCPLQIQFSPKGDRLLAAEHPGGLVAVWDAKSGEQITQFEVGENRYSYEFLHVPADWSVAYSSSTEGRKAEAELLNGKEAVRFTYASALRGFDLQTGKQVAHLQHTPPRCTMASFLSPDRTKIATMDDLPGVFEAKDRGQQREISIWDLATRKSMPLGELGDFALGFSADGKHFAAMAPEKRILKWIDVATGKLDWVYLYKESEQASIIDVNQNGDVIVGVNQLAPKVGGYRSSQFLILDAATGALKQTVEIDSGRGATYSRIGATGGIPLFQASLVSSEKNLFFRDEVRLYSAGQEGLKEIMRIPFSSRDEKFSPNCYGLSLAPHGDWCAAAVNFLPRSRMELIAPTLDPLDFPQPQVWILDLKNGKVAETIDLPQAMVQSVAFSPDGKALAVSGLGRVLSLDLSDLVGR